jgi:O-antigen/teichoic acid export membrane protein
MAWFPIAMALAEVGQSAAVTYWTSKLADRRGTIVSSARRLMIMPSAVVASAGLLLADLLSGGIPDVATAYRIVFVGCIIGALGLPIMFATQAISIVAWNVLRVAQPLTYCLFVLGLFGAGTLTVVSAAAAVVVSVAVQMLVAVVVGWRFKVLGVRPANDREVQDSLLKYGMAYSASFIPTTLAAQYDRVFLGWTVGANGLGQYAVALTVAQLSRPFATGISSAIFPRLSRDVRDDSSKVSLERRTLGVTALVTGPVLLAVGMAGTPLVPLVFGEDFSGAASLIWWLLPVMFLRGLNEVVSVILRGRNRPGRAAVVQLTTLVVGSSLLLLLAPTAQLIAAPIALGVAELVGLTLGLLVIVREQRAGTD